MSSSSTIKTEKLVYTGEQWDRQNSEIAGISVMLGSLRIFAAISVCL